jgi:MoaA/NifB/PqqE/SkfB family radical SAM enzyme
MANPNLKNLTSVYAKTSTLSLTTSASAILENLADSGKVLKISSVVVSNTSSEPKTYTLDFYRSSTATRIVKDLGVSTGSTSVAISRDMTLYLQEGDSLRLTASANSSLEAVCSYEELS